MREQQLEKAVNALRNSKYTIAFTGAGISVESGIPPFRGENGIWAKYDSQVLDLDYFHENPKESWSVIREIFYDYFGVAQPNDAHKVLGRMEQQGLLKCVITQNIDNLHQAGGSSVVYEFHGNSQRMVCTQCGHYFPSQDVNFQKLPVTCPKCSGLVKPDFTFFGESIPTEAYAGSLEAARNSEVCLIIGSLGEVMPAAMVPWEAKRNGATIIEINPKPSNFTGPLTDIHLVGKASEVLLALEQRL
ncbi:NAD-dependent deacylase [Marinilabilia salmonicolor]|jgi:NAD-dependent deacetylase|uniref:protein acetyllysine N-acetyltransferase n=1 Tax=Marinilabilia salmonicolor TaxID=989 RepID=A0A2T0XMF6_9BACT|nr:NAD-dependent deacylase [Marinilabilia salmonicolor]PRZ00107.1 NAD-dependent deacetylase [Marinilabilia salmonicolor]RCW38733.1 NAD-dependent deacetylase [Marinilabilia salmonicolor]